MEQSRSHKVNAESFKKGVQNQESLTQPMTVGKIDGTSKIKQAKIHQINVATVKSFS